MRAGRFARPWFTTPDHVYAALASIPNLIEAWLALQRSNIRYSIWSNPITNLMFGFFSVRVLFFLTLGYRIVTSAQRSFYKHKLSMRLEIRSRSSNVLLYRKRNDRLRLPAQSGLSCCGIFTKTLRNRQMISAV